MYSMYEFRDNDNNILAMCATFGVYMAIKTYYISQGLTVSMDNGTGISYVTNA